MKKLLTLLFAVALTCSLAFAQADTKPADSKMDKKMDKMDKMEDKKEAHMKHHKKHHHKKAAAATTDAPKQ